MYYFHVLSSSIFLLCFMQVITVIRKLMYESNITDYFTLNNNTIIDRNYYMLPYTTLVLENPKYLQNSSVKYFNELKRYSRESHGKLSNMWKKMKGKGVSKNWDLSRKEASDLFQEYYKCLDVQLKEGRKRELGDIESLHAVMALRGERVTLKCMVWFAEQGSLTIKQVDLSDAGQYTCVDNDHRYIALYQLDVRMQEQRVVVREGDSLLNDTYMKDRNLLMTTSWLTWGPCNDCDGRGFRLRQGTCILQKINNSSPVKPKDFPMMQYYPDGVPCHSTATPFRIRRLKEVRGRHEESITAPCNVACSTEAPPVVITDNRGNEVEVMPPGQKFYDIGAKLHIPKMVLRRTIFKPEGLHLIMQCGDVERGSGVRWMRARRLIDPMSIKRQTAGRVKVDSASRLHILTLLMSDIDVYNCWKQARHVVAIKLLVVDGFNKHLKEYITYAGFGITVFAAFVACCRTLKDRNTAK